MPVFFEVRNLTKTFGGLKAVDNISFQLQQGEILGLIGPNGSGKTTTFNCINNFYPITSGDILLKGKSIKGLKTYQICKLGIGRTFQVVKPLARMTVLDNVMAGAFCRVNTIKAAREEALNVLKFCNLYKDRDKLAKSLPIGGRKRLEISRAMATKPELLLLDETAAGLNPGELDEAIGLIRKIRESGVSILIVEHIMKVIMTISDRIHAINFGGTIAEGTPKEVAANRAVIEAYLGEEHAQG
ncbi:MAG: ABC transporter ATP-binding protein [Desulfobacterales bacterium]|nr:ABC transporter ATP-binding protein [Desulfobacterales bacterium]MDD4070989.1 ABC transporter ATP-binding protein [Desulfobacterales bacterium]MDD4391902.1 ABC transporter ATP-binding protein [Desulfobacterales bacterium]